MACNVIKCITVSRYYVVEIDSESMEGVAQTASTRREGWLE